MLSYVNLGLGCIIPLLYTPVMLDILGQEEYGLYSLANSIIGYLTLLNFGMGSAIVRYAAGYRAEGKDNEVRGLIGLFVLIYGILAVCVLLVGGFLVVHADLFFAKGLLPQEVERLKILMIIMIVSTAISLPVSVFSSIISAYERFVFAKLFAILCTIASPLLNIFILYMGYASVGLAFIGLSMQILGGGVYSYYCAKKLGLYPCFRNMPSTLLKEIWIFSAFVFMSAIVDMLYWATDKVLIGAMIGTAAVAVYNVGGVFTSMMQNLSQSISNMFTPRVMMMARDKTSISETSELMIRIGRLQYYIVSFVLSGYIVFGQRFILFWAGEGYGDAYYIALLTMIPLAVPLIQSIAYSTLVARNKHRFRAIVDAIIAVVNVVATCIVIPRFGIVGAAVCTAVAFALGNGIIMNIYYAKVIGLEVVCFWKNILKLSIVPAVLIAVAYCWVNIWMWPQSLVMFGVQVCVFSMLFWACSWIFSMNSYEKELFRGMAVKVVWFLGKK